MLCRFIVSLIALLLSWSNFAVAEIVTTGADQQDLSLTVYNSNLALIRDVRKITIPAGENSLAFKEISSGIQPETAVLKGGKIVVLEQNYEFDLLSPVSLLQKYIGKTVQLARAKGNTGEEIYLEAKVLSTANGVVMQVGDHIETDVHGRIIYPDVPANLREKPTLTMLVANDTPLQQELELSYLSQGLSWKADYVAELNQSEDRIDLKGWVTLTNSSGADYKQAKLQLIAGEVHRAEVPGAAVEPVFAERDSMRMAGPRKNMKRESLFEYHLYSVDRRVTLLDNQTKQIALLQERDGICSKELQFRSQNPNPYWGKVGTIAEGVGVDVVLNMKNQKSANLGSPKPAGIIRVYKKDNAGFLQFIGEDAIDHIPENEEITIKLGRSFDVTADKIQTDFRVVQSGNNQRRINESEYEVTLKNGKEEPVSVTVQEFLPGDWRILQESLPHSKESATMVHWSVNVGAKGSAKLTYRVRNVMQ